MLATILSLLASVQDPRDPAAPRQEPDVLISVSAHADEVRWRQVGSMTVRAWTEPGGNLIEENLTTGLPRPIPGQRTFRDVTWTLKVGACLVQNSGSLDVAVEALEQGSCSTSEPQTEMEGNPQ